MTESELIALYRRYDEPLKAYANRMLNDSDKADDVVCQAWIRVIKGGITDKGAFFPTMCEFVKHRVYDHWKHLKRANRIKAEQPPPAQTVQPSYPERIWKIFELLPLARRVIARMIFIEEYTPKECAAALGISEATVNVQVMRARQCFREVLTW